MIKNEVVIKSYRQMDETIWCICGLKIILYSYI